MSTIKDEEELYQNLKNLSIIELYVFILIANSYVMQTRNNNILDFAVIFGIQYTPNKQVNETFS